jgi:NADP-dependent 3-hydroxy acid dehydrogenase YdfG
MHVNLVAPFHFTRAFLPGMRARKSGHIVLIGSVSDRNIFPGNTAYAASKYGARAMHEVLRLETRGSGVRTSLVSPAATDTDMWDAVDPDNREGFTKRADMLRPEAVAEAVIWTLSRPQSVNIDELRLSSS